MKKRGKIEVRKELERIKRMKTVLLVVILVAFVGLAISSINLEDEITGFIILPFNVEGKEEVIDYLKSTHHFKEFGGLVKNSPVLEKAVLCKDRGVCETLGIKQKIEGNVWEDTYYWYVRFSGTHVIKRENLGFVFLETTKKVYLEFIVRSDGEIMQVHIGETAWEF